jgi:hypothetical protein
MNPKWNTVRVIAFMSMAAAALTVIVVSFLWPQWPQWPQWELEFLGEADFDGQPTPHLAQLPLAARQLTSVF